jgi:hypothetical protein
VVGASDSLCQSCNGSGFDPSILRVAADEAVLKKIILKILKISMLTCYLCYKTKCKFTDKLCGFMIKVFQFMAVEYL